MDGGESKSEVGKNDASLAVSARRSYGPKPALAPKPAIPTRPMAKPRPPRKPSREHIPLPGQSSPSAPPKRAPPPIPLFAQCKNVQQTSTPPSMKSLPSSPELSNVTETPAENQRNDEVEANPRGSRSNLSSPHPDRVSSPGSILSSDSEDDLPVDCGNDSTPWYGVVKIVDQLAIPEVPEEEQEVESHMTEEEKRKFKLHKIAEEIMKTEDTYVSGLELLVKDLRQTLETANQEGRCKVTDDVMKKIFSILPEIYGYHSKMLQELKERLDEWDKRPQIGDIMLSFSPFLKVYANFTMNFEQAIQTITDMSKNDKRFQTVIKAFESQPKCRMLGIAHFMLEPVQRIPRYKLLLLDYIKRLPEDSEDRPATEKALVLVSSAADHANGMMKELEKFAEVMNVQTSLVDKDNLAQPGRTLIKHGMLKKSSRKAFQPRYFFLFTDILLHTAPVNGSAFGEGGLYKVRDRMPVHALSIDEPLVSPLPSSFNIVSVHRSVCLAANSEEEKREWMQVLSEAIRLSKTRLHSRAENGASPELDGSHAMQLGLVAPVWVQDQSTSMCMDCAGAFSVLRRRHHCRCCGKVVCSQCSTNSAYLEYCKKKERICDSCFSKLGGQASKLTKKNKKKAEGPGVREIKGYDKDSDLTGFLHLKLGRGWKRYWFQVKELALFWFKAPEDVLATGNQPLPGLILTTLKKGQEGADREHCFKVAHKNANVCSLVLAADNEEEQERWAKVLEDAIAGITSLR